MRTATFLQKTAALLLTLSLGAALPARADDPPTWTAVEESEAQWRKITFTDEAGKKRDDLRCRVSECGEGFWIDRHLQSADLFVLVAKGEQKKGDTTVKLYEAQLSSYYMYFNKVLGDKVKGRQGDFSAPASIENIVPAPKTLVFVQASAKMADDKAVKKEEPKKEDTAKKEEPKPEEKKPEERKPEEKKEQPAEVVQAFSDFEWTALKSYVETLDKAGQEAYKKESDEARDNPAKRGTFFKKYRPLIQQHLRDYMNGVLAKDANAPKILDRFDGFEKMYIQDRLPKLEGGVKAEFDKQLAEAQAALDKGDKKAADEFVERWRKHLFRREVSAYSGFGGKTSDAKAQLEMAKRAAALLASKARMEELERGMSGIWDGETKKDSGPDDKTVDTRGDGSGDKKTPPLTDDKSKIPNPDGVKVPPPLGEDKPEPAEGPSAIMTTLKKMAGPAIHMGVLFGIIGIIAAAFGPVGWGVAAGAIAVGMATGAVMSLIL